LRALIAYELRKREGKELLQFSGGIHQFARESVMSISCEQGRPDLEGYAFQSYRSKHHTACSMKNIKLF